MIADIGGEVWRICRGKDPEWFTTYIEKGIEPKDVHESEWRWAKLNFSLVIENNDTISDLKNQVSNHLVSI